jgi:hypothetical protein
LGLNRGFGAVFAIIECYLGKTSQEDEAFDRQEDGALYPLISMMHVSGRCPVETTSRRKMLLCTREHMFLQNLTVLLCVHVSVNSHDRPNIVGSYTNKKSVEYRKFETALTPTHNVSPVKFDSGPNEAMVITFSNWSSNPLMAIRLVKIDFGFITP